MCDEAVHFTIAIEDAESEMSFSSTKCDLALFGTVTFDASRQLLTRRFGCSLCFHPTYIVPIWD